MNQENFEKGKKVFTDGMDHFLAHVTQHRKLGNFTNKENMGKK